MNNTMLAGHMTAVTSLLTTIHSLSRSAIANLAIPYPSLDTVVESGFFFRHALASPLSVLIMSLEQTLSCTSSSSLSVQQIKLLTTALSSAKYVQTLYSKQGIHTTFDVQTALSEVVIIARRPDVQSHLIYHPFMPSGTVMMGSKFYFQEALLCELNNAFEAYQENAHNKLVYLKTQLHHHALEVIVADGGSGMNWWQQRLALIPRWSNKRGHTGIGLAFVKRVVEQHFGGTFKLRSAPNCGCTITWVLPIA